jgi:hypothetical protein
MGPFGFFVSCWYISLVVDVDVDVVVVVVVVVVDDIQRTQISGQGNKTDDYYYR